MPFDVIRRYQIKAEPPLGADAGIPFLESTWHQPWSLPVRHKIVPRLRVALMASGPVMPVLEPNAQVIPKFWYQPLAEPKRFRRNLHPSRAPFHSTFFDTTPSASNLIQGWFQPWSLPRWPKKGLRAYLQQTTVQPTRHLPPANVTGIMAAQETNNDVASFAITTAYSVAVSVNVSIKELPDTSAFASIEET